MANGRRSRLTYAKEGPPVLSARIQELYGVEGRFTLGHGRVPVKIEVLAPNQRPIQVTDDLTAFWRDIYPKVKAELSREIPPPRVAVSAGQPQARSGASAISCSSATANSLQGVGMPCLRPKRTMAPLRASVSMGRPASRSAWRELSMSSGWFR